MPDFQTTRNNKEDRSFVRNVPDARPDRVVVLAVSPYPEDHTSLARILSHSNWELHSAWTLQQAQARLDEHYEGVVISEVALPGDHCWKEVLNQTRRITPPPPLVLACQFADVRLWAEVLNLGVYDVLLKPFDPQEVFHVVSSACFSLKNRRKQTAVHTNPVQSLNTW